MDCPSCGYPNPAAARFCGSCAAPLTGSSRCPSCGASNPPEQRFCNACAQPLVEGEAAPLVGDAAASRAHPPEHLAEKIRAGRTALEGERKQVTVLFADVMGSMDLAEQSDAEEWRRIMDRYFSILCDGVHRFEGTVDKFTGDGIMALFGAPIAHEDHARRACYAALHLQRELAAYAAELRRALGLGFSVRMGLNSGEVVVGAIGDEGQMEYTALGHTVGLAQRTEQLAAADRIYLTQHTASLVEGYLALSDLGEFQLKGASAPLGVHELTGVGAARGRLDVQRGRGFSRFVGRDEELGTLESAVQQAFAGQGQVIGIVGEPGVGKSRLCHEFSERQRAKDTPVYHLAGQAHAKSVPLLPVLQLLRSYFEITEQDSERMARERIAGRLLLLDKSFEEDLPLIFDFLAVPDPLRPPPRMDPEARQRQLLAFMKRLTHAQSAREPGVIVVEDLHWLDPASETFLANQVEAVQGTRGLTVLNFRPEYRAPWMSRSYYRQIALAPLGSEATEALLADLLGSDPSLDGLSELIRARTEGNPFFIEELVQALAEAGSLQGERGAYRLAAPVDETAVPASVQAVLAARIDRLPAREKAVLQAAAVIGKEFSQPVLEGVTELSGGELEASLRGLIAGEFVYEQELYPEALYAFKHPLTQEVAYSSQLGERRAALHGAVARAIIACHPERLEERAALVAGHWEAAGETLEAARWHARAAAWAGASDPREALSHERKVRELADSLAESAESIALGITSRILLLQYGWRLGISREEAQAVFEQAERMASRAGDVRSRAVLLASYGVIKGYGEGDVREYARLHRRALALAEETGDAALYINVALAAHSRILLGEYREAVATYDRGIELAAGNATLGSGVAYVCPYAICHAFKGLALAFLGRLAEAQQLIERGMGIAREHGDIETLGWGYQISCFLAYLVGEPESARANARQGVEIFERIGNSNARAGAWHALGVVANMQGQWKEAIEAVERSRAIAEHGRTAVEAEPARLALLAESHLGLGELEQARELGERAVERAHAGGSRSAEPWVNIALARVLLGSAGPSARQEIEAALRRALEITRETEARAWEPMVHVELAELARQNGDQEGQERELREAHRLFSEIGASRHAERLAGQLAMPAS
jgi:class 3 adenylate cyclase/tetratricopeptide (TPR) repeat protein